MLYAHTVVVTHTSDKPFMVNNVIKLAGIMFMTLILKDIYFSLNVGVF
jgi:hypothetical protein